MSIINFPEDKRICTIEVLVALSVARRIIVVLGNAGTAMRPLTAALCLKGKAPAEAVLTGEPRMKERPIKRGGCVAASGRGCSIFGK